MGKMPLTLVVSRNNATLTVVARMPPLQRAKKNSLVMMLVLPSSIGPAGIIRWEVNQPQKKQPLGFDRTLVENGCCTMLNYKVSHSSTDHQQRHHSL